MSLGTVISPAHRNPKNVRQQAAHNITVSGSDAYYSQIMAGAAGATEASMAAPIFGQIKWWNVEAYMCTLQYV